MDLFHKAKVVTLHSHRGKFLQANKDGESVTQKRDGSSCYARWTVEFVPYSPSIIRLKSCSNMYLTASDQPFLPRSNVLKVLQTLPKRPDSSIEWEPIKEGTQVKLKNLQHGNFLRAARGVLPTSDWWNSVTHDHTDAEDGILWDVKIVEMIQIEDLHMAASVRYTHATQEVKQQAEEFFNSMDIDQNGEVSIDEFVEFSRQIDYPMDRKIFAALDRNGDGSLQFAEVLTLHYMMITWGQVPQHFEENLRAQAQQPDAQNARGKKRAAALLALWKGVRVAAAINGFSNLFFDLFEGI